VNNKRLINYNFSTNKKTYTIASIGFYFLFFENILIELINSIKKRKMIYASAVAALGTTETKERFLYPLLNCTSPSIRENIVWSLPIPTFSPM
jgi:hypothetical protein